VSTLVVEVCDVKAVYPHPQAYALEFITVKGWQIIVQKALGLQIGQKVVYFPPDSVLPPELAERLGITKYLAPLPREIDGSRKAGLRVRAARLRGEPSYGTIDRDVDPAWEVGRDVRDHYGVTKFEPPVRPADGDALSSVAAFHGYTEIENIRNFPDVLRPGEEVVITEKLHGKNCRLGLVRVPGEGGDGFEFMAGSNDVRRKEADQKGRPSDFWRPMNEAVRDLLRHLSGGERCVVLFGELYGSGVQDMAYGLGNGANGFRAFDVAVDGMYLCFDEKAGLLGQFGIESVPHLYRGPFTWEAVEEQTYGPTTLCPPESAGRFAGREGCVVTPVVERYDPALGGGGRVILKSISADYLARKGGTDEHLDGADGAARPPSTRIPGPGSTSARTYRGATRHRSGSSFSSSCPANPSNVRINELDDTHPSRPVRHPKGQGRPGTVLGAVRGRTAFPSRLRPHVPR
jgi:RNA ligase (TIGR02306 family)